MRMSVYRDGNAYFLRPQFTPEEIKYLRRDWNGQSDRERLAFSGTLKGGLTLWLRPDEGYRLRESTAPKGQVESRVPCAQVNGPGWTITTAEVKAALTFIRGIPAIYVQPQSPFNGEREEDKHFNPLLSKNPLHWQPPSGKDDGIRIVPPPTPKTPPAPAVPQPVAADLTPATEDVARTVEPALQPVVDAGGAMTAAVEPEGRVAPAEPPPPTDDDKILVVGKQEDEGLLVMAEVFRQSGQITVPSPSINEKLEDLFKAPPDYGKIHRRPKIATPEQRRDDLKQVIALVNSYMDDCGDDIVLKLDQNRLKASVLVVSEVDL